MHERFVPASLAKVELKSRGIMRTFLYIIGVLVLLLSVVIVWGMTRRFERWVAPHVVASVVDSSGNPIQITESEVRILNEAIGKLDVEIRGVGEFAVPPKKAMLRSMIGYSCTETRIDVNPEGYKSASVELPICNEAQLVDRPVLEFKLVFRLATKLEDGESSTEATRVNRFVEERKRGRG